LFQAILGDLKASIVSRLYTSSQALYRLRRLFYATHQKSSRAHSAAPPFQIEPAALGFDLALSRGIYTVGITQRKRPPDGWSFPFGMGICGGESNNQSHSPADCGAALPHPLFCRRQNANDSPQLHHKKRPPDGWSFSCGMGICGGLRPGVGSSAKPAGDRINIYGSALPAPPSASGCRRSAVPAGCTAYQ